MSINLTGLGAVVAVLPDVVGYWPTGSVITVVFSGRRLVVAARLDEADAVEGVETVVEVARREDDTTLFVVGFDVERSTVENVVDGYAAAGLRVADVALVTGSAWVCGDGCCSGILEREDAAHLDYFAASGRDGYTTDRASIEAEYRPWPTADPDLPVLTVTDADLWGAWEAVLGNRWTHEHLASLGASNDPGVRDAVIGVVILNDDAIRGDIDLTREMWADTIRVERDVMVAGLLSAAQVSNLPVLWAALANAHWVEGDGSRARIANEAALAAAPEYRLSALMGRLLDHGIKPQGRPTWTRKVAA